MPSRQREIYSSTLKVAGGTLYYEVEGSGPVLLTIPGGPADAGMFAGLSRALAGNFTVVRYDPRGNSRSILDGPPQDQDMDVHGDDAARLLAIFGSEPAYVLGSSGGAQIGLNLAARHPERVRALVAHEPPCIRLLPDAEVQISNDQIYETYLASGAAAAMQVFLARTGLGGGPKPERVTPPSPEAQESFARMRGNLDFFFAHGFKPISLFVPDVKALKSGTPRIVVGVGSTSSGQVEYRTAVALAERLGADPAVFPGGHTGFTEQPTEFAERLREVLPE